MANFWQQLLSTTTWSKQSTGTAQGTSLLKYCCKVGCRRVEYANIFFTPFWLINLQQRLIIYGCQWRHKLARHTCLKVKWRQLVYSEKTWLLQRRRNATELIQGTATNYFEHILVFNSRMSTVCGWCEEWIERLDMRQLGHVRWRIGEPGWDDILGIACFELMWLVNERQNISK